MRSHILQVDGSYSCFTGTMLKSVFLCGLLLHCSLAYKTLNLLSYVQLPTSINRGNYVFGGINLGTATEAAYDFVNNIVYVIGKSLRKNDKFELFRSTSYNLQCNIYV